MDHHKARPQGIRSFSLANWAGTEGSLAASTGCDDLRPWQILTFFQHRIKVKSTLSSSPDQRYEFYIARVNWYSEHPERYVCGIPLEFWCNAFDVFGPACFIPVQRIKSHCACGETIAKRTITKNRFVSVRSHETPRTESDKHCDQNKANVWAGAAVVILKAKIFVNSSVYRSRNKRNGRHQTLLLGWVQNRLKISRKMAGITERVGEFGAESIHTFPETGERPRKVQALVSGMFTGILYGEKR